MSLLQPSLVASSGTPLHRGKWQHLPMFLSVCSSVRVLPVACALPPHYVRLRFISVLVDPHIYVYTCLLTVPDHLQSQWARYSRIGVSRGLYHCWLDSNGTKTFHDDAIPMMIVLQVVSHTILGSPA